MRYRVYDSRNMARARFSRLSDAVEYLCVAELPSGWTIQTPKGKTLLVSDGERLTGRALEDKINDAIDRARVEDSR